MSGKVVGSKNADYPVGTLMGLRGPLTTVQTVTGEALAATAAWRLDGVCDEAGLASGVGAFGMPGCTAYAGLVDVLRPVAGETIVVTAASGAVGALVGQIAKHAFGCRVIGVTGGADKAAALTETYGFDAAIDWQAVGNSRAALAAAIKAAAGEKGSECGERAGLPRARKKKT
jgi:NADPH-dependent curcumin reductase CurA